MDARNHKKEACSAFAFHYCRSTRIYIAVVFVLAASFYFLVGPKSVVGADKPFRTIIQVTPNRTYEFDIPVGGDLIILPVVFAGKRTRCLFDTGSEIASAAASTFEGLLGKPIRSDDVTDASGKTTPFKVYRCPPCSVGELPLPGRQPVLCAPFEHMRSCAGHDFTVVLGPTSVGFRTMQVDFGNGKLRFLSPLYTVKDAGFQQGAFWNGRGLYEMNAVLPGEIGTIMETSTGFDGENRVLEHCTHVLIDTGLTAPSVTLKTKLFDQLLDAGYIKQYENEEWEAVVFSGIVKSNRRRGILKSIRVGPSTLHHLTVAEAPRNAIGLGVLSRFIVTIRFSVAGRIYLKPTERVDEPDRVDCSGLALLRDEGNVMVYDVRQKSPADGKDIIKKDVLLRIDGKDAEEYSLFQIRKLLSREDKQVRLTLRRGGKTFDATLDLRDYHTYLDPPKPQKDTKPEQEAKSKKGAELPFRPLPLP